ncbi:MAG: CBS domain-containing protein [Labilithrix sp.]|nr:CBS domain-containing protein [Labilithrix sp.]
MSRAAHLEHPILRLDVVRSDGTRQSTHRVFCRLRRESVPVGVCCACAHCDAIRAEPSPAVACTVAGLDELPPDTDGMRTEVGTLLHDGATVVEESASLRDAFEALRASDQRAIAVVNEARALVGVLHEAAFVGRLGRAMPTVARAMSKPIALPETVPVRAALRVLASSHLREATVVTSKGTPLGIFRDVDGLRWIARARR